MLNVSIADNPGSPAVVLTVQGNLDLDTAPLLADRIEEALARPEPRVVVDLAGVDFCDSIGLSTFVIGHNRAKWAGGWLRIAGPGEFLERLLDTVGLTQRLGIYPSVADALADRQDGHAG
ncbi:MULTISPECIES: STAS domain-containing protein [Actinoplanes]|uniref:STAS domain-containing protein n=1 Tax=Actinoplanes TaxID=1865 RepID=UPI0009F984B6|nr:MULTISPECIES: STAS domain-containing protein [Actinoplanes]GLY06381.1 anti-sigma factor antagonist [Actinoplanes sp. NBRC 101535]